MLTECSPVLWGKTTGSRTIKSIATSEPAIHADRDTKKPFILALPVPLKIWLLCVGSITPVALHAQAGQSPSPVALEPGTQTASTRPPEDGGMTNEIIVTAQKREQTLSSVPMSISAVTGDQLAAKGIVDVQGLVKVVPGLSYVENGNSVPVYSLRGVGFFDTAIGARPTVSVYLDQVPLPFSIEATGAALDVERIEVLKGPQGTLFGQNATGGAINYIAARPTDAFEGGVSASFARFNSTDLSGFLSGPVSQTVNARLAVRSVQSGGWQRSHTRSDDLGDQRLLQGRLLVDWAAADNLSLKFNISGFRDRSDTQAGQLLEVRPLSAANARFVPLMVNYPLAPKTNRAADWDIGEDFRRNNKFYQLSVRADYDLSDAIVLTSITAYSRMNIHQKTDQDATSLEGSSADVRGRLTSFSQEARFSLDLGRLQAVGGLYYSRDKSSEQNAFNYLYSSANFALPGTFGLSVLDARQNAETKAIFGSIDFDISSTITAYAGARYTKTDLDYSACTRAQESVGAATLTAFYNRLRANAGQAPISPLAPGDCISVDATLTPAFLTDKLDEDNVSWRVGLDWEPAPQTLLYANVSRGYKAGSVPTPPALGNAAFRPVTQESVLAYEIGFKAPIIRRRLEASGAVFYYDYTNKQVLGRVLSQPTVLGALQALVNIPKSRVKGAEIQLNAFPTPGLTLSVGATYLDSNVTKDFVNFTITSAQANFKGDPFPYTPKYQVTADAQYEYPISDNLSGIVGANAAYRSSTTSGFGNVDILAIDSYTIVDFRTGIKEPNDRWQATLFVRNATNEYYWTNVARLTDTIRRLTGMPRTYGLQFSARF